MYPVYSSPRGARTSLGTLILVVLHSLARQMLYSVAALTSGFAAPTALPQSRAAATMSMNIGGLKEMAKEQNPVVVRNASVWPAKNN